MDARGDAKYSKGNYTPTMYRHYRKTIQRYWLEYCPDLELKLVKYETFDEHAFTLDQYMTLVRYMRTNAFYHKGKAW